MTAEAFVYDDPDATWIDPLRGRRGLVLPEAATACLPMQQTACLDMVRDLCGEVPLPAPASARAAASAPESTRLGDLVSDAAIPAAKPLPLDLVPELADDLPDVHTVCAYDEPVRPATPARREDGRAGSPRPSPLPALGEARPASSPWAADEGPRDGLPALALEVSSPSLDVDLRVTPVSDAAIDAAAALASPAVAPEPSHVAPNPVPASDTAPMRPAKPRGPFDVSEASGRADTALRPADAYDDLPAPVRPAGRKLPPNVPTWASCRTQMEGPGLWMEEEAPAVRVRDPEPRAPSPPIRPELPAHARVPSIATPQRYVPTTITPTSDAQVPAARGSRMQEILPFALVLVAITLATAAAVGAYL